MHATSPVLFFDSLQADLKISPTQPSYPVMLLPVNGKMMNSHIVSEERFFFLNMLKKGMEQGRTEDTVIEAIG